MSDSHPDPELAGAGLSATGRTADEFAPGDESPGTAYGAPAGTGAAERESVADPDPDPDSDAGRGADAEAEGSGA